MSDTTRRTMAGELAHLKTLEDAVADYRQHSAARYQGVHHDPVLLHTMAASSLTEAIERACAGVTADGKKFRHDQYLRSFVGQNPAAATHQERERAGRDKGLRRALRTHRASRPQRHRLAQAV